jgi:DNA processing protein
MKAEYILTLLSISGIGIGTARLIDENIKESINTFDDFLLNLKEKKPMLPQACILEKYILEKSFEFNLKLVDETEKLGIKIITRDSPFFPKTLSNIPNSPVVLYAKGNLNLFKETNNVAVVGTRNPSEYGKRWGARLTQRLVENFFIIVSGLAVGCDTIAHESCLRHGGKTVAILANGLDRCYPKENQKLSEKILENGGLLLSEYKIREKTQRAFFVARDRLQSGFSKAVCVIETGVEGGTRHTVKFAEEQNKLIACLEYPKNKKSITNSAGNDYLIKDKGAIPISSPGQILGLIKKIKEENIGINTAPKIRNKVKEVNKLQKELSF